MNDMMIWLPMLANEEIYIFSQIKEKRIFVGRLWRKSGFFYFEYSPEYKKAKTALALGPEFPIWKSEFKSKTLFASLQDRIPSRQNPAYKDYCKEWGIDENETDELVLLTTIGKRGPSTFIFEPTLNKSYTGNDLRKFRSRLGLSQSEFELLFEVAHATLVRLENATSQNPFYLRYFEVFDKIPEALKLLIQERGIYLHDEKKERILKL